MRIISVVPSLTELVYDLGLESQLVGITRFCIHPQPNVKRITKVGGTKTLNIDRIIDLTPDLIIANKEENSKEDIEKLQRHCNVWVTEINTLNEALTVITELGIKANVVKKATLLVTFIKSNFKSLARISNVQKSVAYLIWEDPIMVAGKNTFINEMIHSMGLKNILTDPLSRYPIYNPMELENLQPDLIFLSSEPYPFKKKHLEKYQHQFPKSQIVLVDGEMFSWYGSRMKLAPSYFKQLLHELI